MTVLLSLHILACAGMTSVIWLVQLLIYPGFCFVDSQSFSQMHKRHTSQITWIVGPLMLIELSTAVLLFFYAPSMFYSFNLISVISLWAITAFISVPLHEQLSEKSKCLVTIQKLAQTNWLRTVLWSLRLIFLLFYGGISL